MKISSTLPFMAAGERTMLIYYMSNAMPPQLSGPLLSHRIHHYFFP
jgi:hypothetical protein